MQIKYCSFCDTNKPITDFPVSRRKSKTVLKNGSSFKRSEKSTSPEIEYHTYCKKCNAIKAKEFRARHFELTGDRNYSGSGKISKYPKEDRPLMSAIRKRITSTKRNCKKSNVVFNLTEEYLYKVFKNQEGLCALSGIPIQVDGNTNLRLSIDRIDSDFGYIEGNIQWTIFATNRAKGDLTQDDFITMCSLVVERATTIERTADKAGS